MTKNNRAKRVSKPLHVWLGKNAIKRGWNDYRVGKWDADYERKDAPLWYEAGRACAAAAASVYGPDLPKAKSGEQLVKFLGNGAYQIWDAAKLPV